MTPVPRMAQGKISLAGLYISVPVSFYFLCPTSTFMLWRTYVPVHTPDAVQAVYELPSLSRNTAAKHFYTNRSSPKCWLDIYHWGAGLAVTGRIRDNGQKVLQSSFRTGSNDSPSYFHIFFVIAFLADTFIRNIIILLCINYIIIIYINDNTVINNNSGRLQNLILLFKISIGTRKDFFEICIQVRHAPSKSFASHTADGWSM